MTIYSSLLGSSSSSSSIGTIAGDSGSITGANVTIFANRATKNAGSSVGFDNSGTTSTFNVTDADDNTMIGNLAGNVTMTGAFNTAVGDSAGRDLTVGGSNSLLGRLTGKEITSGMRNTAMGGTALGNLLTGNDNTCFGYNAGVNYTAAESDNIILGTQEGTVGESGVIRIGTAGEQTTGFFAGITGVTAVGSPVAVSSTGQLSDLGFGTAAQVLTSNGAGVSPTWQAAAGGSTVQFQAYLTSNQAVAGGNTTTTIVFDTAITNVGSAYATGTGIFTAPATGFYGFATTVNYLDLNVPVGLTEILLAYTGSAQSLRLIDQGIGGAKSGVGIILTASWAMPMTSGDTVQIQPYCDGTGNYAISGAALTSGAFNTASTFSGWRIA